MKRTWDYRYELRNFRRDEHGVVSYTTKDKGEVQLRKTPPVGLLKLLAWQTAREIAETTGKDVVVRVRGEEIVSRTERHNSRFYRN